MMLECFLCCIYTQSPRGWIRTCLVLGDGLVSVLQVQGSPRASGPRGGLHASVFLRWLQVPWELRAWRGSVQPVHFPLQKAARIELEAWAKAQQGLAKFAFNPRLLVGSSRNPGAILGRMCEFRKGNAHIQQLTPHNPTL